MAVDAEHATFLVALSALLGRPDVDASGERGVDLVGDQRLVGVLNHDERGRARRVDTEARPPEVQLVGDARGDVVLLVGDLRGNLAHDGELVGPGEHVEDVVEVVAHPGPDADGAPDLLPHVACVLEGLPGDLEEDPQLGGHELRLARADVEERGVELVDVLEHATGRDVARVVAILRRDQRIELVAPERGHGLATFGQDLPQLVEVAGPREAPGRADNRDVERRGGRRRAPSRQRVLVRLADRRGVRVAPLQVPGEGGNRGMLEDPQDRDFHPEPKTDLRGDGERSERRPPQVEEVVVNRHRRDAEDRAPDLQQRALDVAPRTRVGRGHDRLRDRLRQGRPVHLPVGRAGDGVEAPEPRRDHVGGQHGGAVGS